MSSRTDDRSDGGWVYSKTIRLANGKVLRASDYGLQAFRFKPKKKRRPK